jgi:2-amino-4-hydroxy-6-hydroxymethyldihydropteridine diphosphokinase
MSKERGMPDLNLEDKGYVQAITGIGSNLGESGEILRLSISDIAGLSGVEPLQVSKFYYTEPQDVKKQPWFTNAVAIFRVDTSKWSALEFLQALLRIEERRGRIRLGRQGPRLVDLDLLIFGRERISSPELTLPHPRMHRRAFVLVPLAELCPGMLLPGGKRVEEYLERIEFTVSEDRIWQT